MAKNPLLFFCMQLDNTPALNMGRLFLIDQDTGFLGRWVASSGLGDWQSIGEWNRQAKGCIPPNYKLKGVPLYKVSTRARWQNMSGLQSNTYEISPITVTTSEGVSRGEFLIHKSRFAHPMSGSLGCIVLPEGEFADFEKTYAKHCAQLEQVLLLVGYTYD
jgi:hypothetical protein